MFKLSLSKSKELLKGKRLTVWGVIIVYVAVMMGVTISRDAVLINCASFLVGMPAAFGFMKYFINLYHKKEKLEDLVYYFENYTKNFKIILATLWYCLIVCTGLILLIVPGIIWAYRYILVPFILISDERVSIKKSFDMSREKMHGHKFKFFAAEIVLQIAPLILIFLGTFAVALGSFNLAEENPDKLAAFEKSVMTFAERVEEMDEDDIDFEFTEVKDDIYQEVENYAEEIETISEDADANVIETNHKTPWGYTGVIVIGAILLTAGWVWIILLYPRIIMIETVYAMELLAKDKKEEIKE